VNPPYIKNWVRSPDLYGLFVKWMQNILELGILIAEGFLECTFISHSKKPYLADKTADESY